MPSSLLSCLLALGVAQAPRAPEAPAPHPPSSEQAQGFASRLFGAQLQWGGPRKSEAWGGSVSQHGFSLMSGKWVNFRYLDQLSLGGQGGALHYRVAAQISLGAIYRIIGDHGPVARLGLALDWQRNHALRALDLSVPELHLGWSGVEGALQYELAASASPLVWMFTKSYATAQKQQMRRPAFGAVATLIYKRVRANAQADWSVIQGQARPRVAADLCVHLVKRKPKPGLQRKALIKRKAWFGPHEQRYRAGICANARVNAQRQAFSAPRSQHFALSIRLGKISFLDPLD